MDIPAVLPSLLDMPDECLLNILCKLDTLNQLRAAQTCTRLQQLFSISSVSSRHHTQAKHDSLLLYLARHGQHVTSIDLERGSGCSIAALPSCPQLKQLAIADAYEAWDEAAATEVPTHHALLQLAAANDQPGLLPLAATGLTHLSINARNKPLNMAAAAADLSALPQLRHLELTFGVCTGACLPGGYLSALPQLTELRLGTHKGHGGGVDDDSLQHLSTLTHLQVLEWSGGDAVTGASLSQLAHLQQLTALYMAGAVECVGGASSAGITSLTNLRHLELRWIEFQPTVLASFTQLHSLVLECCDLLGAEEGTVMLLAHIPRLQQLRHLALPFTLNHQAPASEAYSALVASSRLTELALGGAHLPQGTYSHIFDVQRPLPCLERLWLDGAHNLPVSVDDLAAVVTCCPNLHELGVSVGGNANGRSVQLLSELPGLTRLRVGPASDALAASGLCKLPQLELLELDTLDVNFTHLGLLQLAALTGLTILITHPGGDEVQDAATYAGTLTNQAPPGSPPDVWRQILDTVLLSDQVSPVPVSTMAQQAWLLMQARQQLEEQQEQLAATEARLAATEARLAAQTVQVKQLAAQVTQLQELAEDHISSRSEVAELQMRLEALGQLVAQQRSSG